MFCGCNSFIKPERVISHRLLSRLDLLEGLRGDARAATGSHADVLVGICKLWIIKEKESIIQFWKRPGPLWPQGLLNLQNHFMEKNAEEPRDSRRVERVSTHIYKHTHTVHNHLSFTIQGRKHILNSSIITHIYKHWFCSEGKASPWQPAFNASHFFLLPIKNQSGFWLTVARLMLKMMAAVQNRPLRSRSVHNRAMFHSFLVWYFQTSCLTSLS